MNKIATIFLLLATTTTLALLGTAFAETDIKAVEWLERKTKKLQRARTYIKAMQPVLFKELAYSEEVLRQEKPDYQEHYGKAILPRLKNVSRNLFREAIHWVDFDGDGEEELLFWTEGLAPNEWGAREKIFVVRIGSEATKNSAKVGERYLDLVASKEINPILRNLSPLAKSKQRSHTRYVGSSFQLHQRKDGSFVWVLSFEAYDRLYERYPIVEMAYNPKNNKVEFNEVNSYLPIGVRKGRRFPVASKADLKETKKLLSNLQSRLRKFTHSNNTSNLDAYRLYFTWGGGALIEGSDATEVAKVMLRQPSFIHAINQPYMFFWTKGFGGEDYLFAGYIEPTSISVYRFKSHGYKLYSFDTTRKLRYRNDWHGLITFIEEGTPIDTYHVIEIFFEPHSDDYIFRQYKTSFPVGVR